MELLEPQRTPVEQCPACNEKRLHTKDEWKLYHPHAGEGKSYEIARKTLKKKEN